VVLVAIIIAGGVDDRVPDLTVLRVRKREVDRLRSGVEQQQEVVVENPLS